MRLKRLRKAGDVAAPAPELARPRQPTQLAVAQQQPQKKRKTAETEHVDDRLPWGSADQQTEEIIVLARAGSQQNTKSRVASRLQGVSHSLDTLSDDPQTSLEPLEVQLSVSDQQSEEEDAFEEREDDRANDPACIQCDDGGDIMWCDGSCMRAFHCGVEKVGKDDQADSVDSADEADVTDSQQQLQPFHCNPLNMPLDLYQRLKDTKDTLHCPNCLTGVHQCFLCKKEGVVEAHAADPANAPFANNLVFRCGVAACGRFYHAECMKSTQDEMQGAFFCPLHTCKRCGGDQSDRKSEKGELIPCRRCPKAFHERCMPSSLLEPLDAKRRDDWKCRIWIAQYEDGGWINGVERSLIYCIRHKMGGDSATPDHETPVFHPILLQRWKEHFAKEFPTLVSSKAVQKQEEDEDIPLATRRRRSSDEEPASQPLPLSRPGPNSAKPPRPPSSTGLRQAAAKQQLPLRQAASKQASAKDGAGRQAVGKLDAGKLDASKQKTAQQVTGRQTASTQNAAKQDVTKVVGTKQPSAKQAVDKQTAAHQGSVKQLAGQQLTAAQRVADSSKSLPRPTPQAASSLAPRGLTASPSKLPSCAQTAAACQAPAAVPGVAQMQKAPAVREPMGPPPARKRPLLPDRSAMPHKKRRATVAAPAAVGRAPTPADLPESSRQVAADHDPTSAAAAVNNTPKQISGHLSSVASRSAHPPAVPDNRTHAKKQEATTAAAARAAKAPSAAPPATTAGKSAASTSPGAAPSAARTEPHTVPHHSSPVQIVQHEDVGEVDIGDDYVPGPELHEPEVSDAAVAALPPAKAASTDSALAGEAARGTQPRAAADQVQAGPAVAAAAAATVSGEATDVAAVAAAPSPPARVWELTTAYARQLKSMSLEERKQEAANRVQRLINSRKGKVTLDMVKRNTRTPEPYSKPSKMTVTEERLQVAERAVANAKANPSRANIFVDKAIAMEMLMHEDNLTMVLAPYLRGNRYSSYGRHFTKLHLLEQVAQLLSFYLHDGDTVVDFSCGANAFVPLVKKEGKRQGLSLKGKAYDIITSQNLEDFDRSSWLDTRPGMLPPGKQLVIGLNPPFGKNNMLATKFVQHAARFLPRVIVLIVPPQTPIPLGYTVMYEDHQTMSDRSFFVPGATHDSWNKTTPALRVLVRTEWLNWAPPDGTGWYTASAPRFGTRRQAFHAAHQHVAPQQHPSWHQTLQNMPAHQMHPQQHVPMHPQHMQQQQHLPLHVMQQQQMHHQQQLHQQHVPLHQMQQQRMHQQQVQPQQVFHRPILAPQTQGPPSQMHQNPW